MCLLSRQFVPLAGGSLSVDAGKMQTVYGEAARQVAQVIK